MLLNLPVSNCLEEGNSSRRHSQLKVAVFVTGICQWHCQCDRDCGRDSDCDCDCDCDCDGFIILVAAPRAAGAAQLLIARMTDPQRPFTDRISI